MKKLFPLLLLPLTVGAYYAYKNPQVLNKFISFSQQEESTDETQSADIIFTTNQATEVLGATVSQIGSTARSIIDKVTDEQEEALINKTVENISKQVKDLPEQQVRKIKVEFCKDVIDEYESTQP